jgi:hypothetical protein
LKLFNPFIFSPFFAASAAFHFCIKKVKQKSVSPSNIQFKHGKLQRTGLSLGRFVHARSGCMHAVQILFSLAKLANVELKTWLKQLLGFLPLAFGIPG